MIKEFNIKTTTEVRDRLKTGPYQVQLIGNQWFICRTKDGIEERWYVPPDIHRKFPKEFPKAVAEKQAEQETQQLVPITIIPELQKLPPVSPTPILPEEFIIHETELRLLETIGIIENLHLVENDKKHELPLAQPKGDNKFSFKTSGEIMFSLADLAIYFLIKCHKEYQDIEDALASARMQLQIQESLNNEIQNAITVYENEIVFGLGSEQQITNIEHGS